MNIGDEHGAPRSRWFVPGALAVLAAAVLGVAGCGGDEDAADEPAGGSPATSAPEVPDSMTISLPTEIPPFDPHVASNSYWRSVTGQIYDTLLSAGPDVEPAMEPSLAAEMPEQVNPTTWRFRLREGASFTNGEPVDAKAVAFSIRRVLDPDTNSEQLATLGPLKTARVVDDLTVDLITKTPDALLPQRTRLLYIVPPKYFEQNPEKAVAEPIGSGPYTLAENPTGGPYVLERNPDYWGEPAKIETVTLRVMAGIGTQISALKAGEVDLVTKLPPDATSEAPKLYEAPGTSPFMLRYNSEKGITADPRVRRALTMAIDRNALADEMFSGYADVTQCQIMQQGGVGYNESLEALPFDPEQARALLEEAGVVGESIPLVTGRFFPKGTEAVEVIASYWTEIGLKPEIDVIPDTVKYAPMYFSGVGRPEAVFVLPGAAMFDAAPLASYYVPGPEGADGSSYHNAEVDRLFEQALSTPDLEEHVALVEDLLATTCEDAAIGDLINAKNLWGAAEWVEWSPRAFDWLELDISRIGAAGQ